MRSYHPLAIAGSLLIAIPSTFAATSVERIANSRVHVTEVSLAPGESQPIPAKLPGAVVYMSAGTAEIAPKSVDVRDTRRLRRTKPPQQRCVVVAAGQQSLAVGTVSDVAHSPRVAPQPECRLARARLDDRYGIVLR